MGKFDQVICRDPSSSNSVNLPQERNCHLSGLLTGLSFLILFVHYCRKGKIQLWFYHICNTAHETIHKWAICLLFFAYHHIHSFNHSFKKYLLHPPPCPRYPRHMELLAVPLMCQASLCLCLLSLFPVLWMWMPFSHFPLDQLIFISAQIISFLKFPG